jgi:hypothetical protein
MFRKIDEIVRIYVFFDGGKMIPFALIWEGQRYEKLKLLRQWAMKRNDGWLNQYFQLSDGENTFEVMYDPKEIVWKLISIC